jgi:hypothetical protein
MTRVDTLYPSAAGPNPTVFLTSAYKIRSSAFNGLGIPIERLHPTSPAGCYRNDIRFLRLTRLRAFIYILG